MQARGVVGEKKRMARRVRRKEGSGHGAHQLEDECPVAVELEERDVRHEHAANTLDDVRVHLGSGQLVSVSV